MIIKVREVIGYHDGGFFVERTERIKLDLEEVISYGRTSANEPTAKCWVDVGYRRIFLADPYEAIAKHFSEPVPPTDL